MPTDAVHFPKLVRRARYSFQTRYRAYRQEIREDCIGRCIYCDAHENELGGSGNMTLDHFRPRSYSEFSHLVHDPHNLVWACRKCNELKADKWPAKAASGSTAGNEGFIDPFIDDRREYFDVLADGRLLALKSPASYLIVLLVLNRAGMRLIRQKRDSSRRTQVALREYLQRETERINRLLEEEGRNDDERGQLLDDRKRLAATILPAIDELELDFELH